MNDYWFALYHAYTTSTSYHEKALKVFEEDVKFSQKIGIKTLIMEDYYKPTLWGEYTSLWNGQNLSKMIKIVHDYGIKFIPYTNATELSISSETYKKNGKKWGAKNRWGKIYSGFNSIFLPNYYPDAFFTKIMCPKTGWKDHLLTQIEQLFENFEFDGIYFDRVDYRVKCHDHSNDFDHFKEELPILIKDLIKVATRKSRELVSIMNDSCMAPDETMIKCMNNVNVVLSELLPIDWDPNSLLNKLNYFFGDIAWRLRNFLMPITRFITEKQFQSTTMINTQRISEIIRRLKIYKKPENIVLFTHRRDELGLNTIKFIAEADGCKVGYFRGLKRLISLKNWNI